MKALVPPAVLEVCQTLREAGYQAWVVGGAVRDLLLGKIPSDWDVATDSLPEKVLSLFERTIATGLQHGTVTAVVGRGHARENVEITTFRGEGAYSDARRPDAVNFGVPLDEDLKRRDFVINAMAFDPVDGRVHDPFGGAEDLQQRLVRAVGVASERFNEDGLRVMRAVRFVSTLNFSLEAATEEGLASALDALSKVAQERIRVELLKLLSGQAPDVALRIAHRRGVLKVILSELEDDQCAAAFARVALCKRNAILRFAALLAHVDADRLEPILRRLTMSNEDRQRILAMLRHYPDFAAAGVDEVSMRKHLSGVGRKAAFDHLEVLQAEAEQAADSSLRSAIDGARQLLESSIALEVADLAINGARVMELTGAKGRLVGDILRALLEKVLTEPSLNTVHDLETLASELASANPGSL